MKLVVIEGPGKQATIKKYLGDDYTVFASKGHVRDLPEKTLAIDINNNFEPTYINVPDKKSIINELKNLAKKSDEIYLATDPDREGEAISWHIAHILGLPRDSKCRITFNEISQKAVTNALKEPRQINYDLVDAQQARRVLDRLVGYKISPILSKRLVFDKLSAGRVQSVALELVVEREREILNFKPEEYWTLNVMLEKDNVKFKVNLISKNGKKYTIKSKQEMDEVLACINNANFIVGNVKREIKKVRPQAPFITSTMQQDAGSKLKFNLNTTSKVAQSLYEGVNTKTYGKKALITYIRTDSTRVSQDAQISAKEYITKVYGEKYAPKNFNIYASKASAQEGHEAIRPIDINITPESIKGELTTEQYKLYKLIYDRFLASQMSDALFDTLTVEINADIYTFKVIGKTPVFDGFQAVYKAVSEDEETSDKDIKLPNLESQDMLKRVDVIYEQKFTKPPSRYTEPSFIKLMENKGIGRPATYAQTVNTLFKRNYCALDGKYFVPTEIGFQVCDFLCQNFPDVMDVGFTAEMEEKLDHISKGQIEWSNVISDFYKDLEEDIVKVMGYIRENPIESDEICDECGAKLFIKSSVNGKFLGCSNYPKCKFTKSLNNEERSAPIETEVKCEKCGSNMVIRSGKNGKFLACPKFPECKFTLPYFDKDAKIGECPECHKVVTEQKSKKGTIFFGCTGYPNCKFMSWDLPLKDKCPNCDAHLYKKYRNDYTEVYCSKKCGYNVKTKINKDDVKE